MKRRNQSQWRKVIASPFAMVLFLVALFFVSEATAKMYSKNRESQVRYTEAESRLARAVNNQNVISEQIKNLSSDEGIETEMRKKYHAVEPGEQVAVVINTSPQATSTTRPASDTNNTSMLARFLRAIGL